MKTNFEYDRFIKKISTIIVVENEYEKNEGTARRGQR